MYVLSQVASSISLCLVVYSLQIKDNKALFLLQIISNFTYAISFLLLHQLSGSFVALVGSIRFLLFYLTEKNKVGRLFSFYFISILYLVFCFTFCVSALEVFVYLAAIFYTYTCSILNENLIRIGSIAISVSIIFLNISCGNMVAIVMETISIASALIFLISHNKFKSLE